MSLLSRIANQIMGYQIVEAREFWKDKLANRIQICADILLHAGPPAEALFYTDGYFLGREWSPDTDTLQALQLLEVWCKRKPEERSCSWEYVPPRLTFDGEHRIVCRACVKESPLGEYRLDSFCGKDDVQAIQAYRLIWNGSRNRCK